MFPLMKVLNRALLIAGVLVALTPCGFCHQAMGSTATACSMKSMSGQMDCCHKSKPVSPLCKVMDQSSMVSAGHSLAPAPVVVVHPFVVPSFVPAGVPFHPSTPIDTSPFRAPLSLRI
ncbi:MAG TPA: hypothetical protein VHE12_00905 [bacterium]|nr:hypothetical protein [bacterium]